MSLPRVVEVSGRPSRRLLSAWAAFGIVVARARRRRVESPGAEGARVLSRVEAGASVVLITGPSGAGKSRLLRSIGAEARRRGRGVRRVRPVRGRRRAIIDLFRGSLAEAIASLCRAGLGEPALLGRRPHELSEGEHARVALALAMHRARGVVLLADEWCATLDGATAASVCASLARWTHRTGSCLVCATTRDDVVALLSPDVHVRVELGGACTILPSEGEP